MIAEGGNQKREAIRELSLALAHVALQNAKYKMHHCMQCKIQKGEVIRELSLVGRLLASAVRCIHGTNAS